MEEGEWPETQKEYIKYIENIIKKWGPIGSIAEEEKIFNPNSNQTTNQKSHKIKENKTNPK